MVLPSCQSASLLWPSLFTHPRLCEGWRRGCNDLFSSPASTFKSPPASCLLWVAGSRGKLELLHHINKQTITAPIRIFLPVYGITLYLLQRVSSSFYKADGLGCWKGNFRNITLFLFYYLEIIVLIRSMCFTLNKDNLVLFGSPDCWRPWWWRRLPYTPSWI